MSDPPVAPTVYVDPAPTIKRFLRSGVPLEPLHNAQPDGIFEICPDHNRIIPDGNVEERNSFPRIHALVFPIISLVRRIKISLPHCNGRDIHQLKVKLTVLSEPPGLFIYSVALPLEISTVPESCA